MDILVGHTGFVGGNISANHKFYMLCNSKNITEAFYSNPDILVYAGIPAEMFLANSNPSADREVCETATDSIRKICPRRIVLISTIAVVDDPVGTDESVTVDESKLTAYGLNRLALERAVTKIVPKCNIIRLPALFGQGIKKNYIYDMINSIPSALSRDKFDELSEKEPRICESYVLQENGFYILAVSDGNKTDLMSAFRRCCFTALNFTDSRSIFQYYNLKHLWGHIETVLLHDIPLFHAATAPVSAGDVHEYVFGTPFENILPKSPFNYDFRTKYADLFGGERGYIMGRERVLAEIKEFVEAYRREQD